MQITRDDSLKLLGLFTLATDHYAKLREVEFAINRALGRDGSDQGVMSDAIYKKDGGHTAGEFYDALAREGVTVIDDNNSGNNNCAEIQHR